ncbi:Dihydrolipoyllysine-residue acetyltransferase component of pyruvate dehydrogenase complex (E2) (Dihydrolipoamide acetyltransferase component of pyruvate dehydrogenase complex) [Agrobacterium fabacearum S56]|uniref:pyruvate dehydrogenase complex dihydrolipoamide acetyltransferase n=1 Tax=Agrobacterium tumefaciens TaxID=358 RepID=UPI0009BC20B6|nr:pyruvate dehydrogenase complex dihydrolipoamide acetyltransferase [Agrobacterium tumefaciens]AYM10617.1 dihydrolipoamide acetyltransferase [Agrobacterium tumefaciens]NSY90024.1 pyruvate dehydrogenase complex dihydrolipoamide acetyltransferase [Agrobacterium tumefaciens]CUW96195.1 Dihydrolipoyllysine-residue acetyltransferase component of pyruvate dehydrogenase complex (E2) (Dihydrolipoamide acetyltransferase component of pyruvate dehydrogenase complex) [Agrobacterium fabacearum S56]
MPINITMPALSPTMEEGNLAKWLVKEGDKVAPGDVIAEIETDKATMEVEAVDEGTVAKLVVPAGTEAVKVNALIAILAADGEDVAEAAKGGNAAPAASQAKAEAPKQEAAKAEAPKEEAVPAKAEKPAADQASAPSTPAPVAKSGERIFASPLARRLAKEAGLDLTAVSGSGPHGRIVKTDVEKAAASGAAKAAPAAAASAGAPAPALAKGPSEEAVLKLFEPGSYELVPHDGMRKVIAKRLVESKQTVPHFYVSVDCELDTLLALRAQLNAAAPEKDGKPAYKLSVNDMVIKALALALRDVPDANVSWTESNMVKHKHSDVGVAVSIPGGLITPIIRKAEEKSLSTISNEMKDYGKRAKERKLKPEEYQGGTTAVSNMGMMGVKSFSAVINPPHATILAVGAGEQRAVVKNGEIKIANVMTVTLSTDHRCVDGALGAELIGAFKRYIENPMGMLV